MAIVSLPLPQQLVNGTVADAGQVMTDLNAIASNVNANAAKNGVNSDITSLTALVSIAAGLTITNANINGATITGGTISGATITNTGGTFTNPAIIGGTATGLALDSTSTAPTAPVGTNTNEIATMAAIINQAFQTTLPAQSSATTDYVPMSRGASQVVQWVPTALASANTVTSGTNVTLTVASASVQSVIMTAASLAVILPDQTTLTQNGISFMVHNIGNLTFVVQDAVGNVLAAIPANGKAIFICLSRSSAGGNWKSGNISDGQLLPFGNLGSNSTITATTLGIGSLVSLSSTTAVYAYISSGGTTLTGIILSISGNTFTSLNGAGTTIWSLGTSWEPIVMQVVPGSSTQFSISTAGTSEYPQIAICTVSGSTLSTGTPVVPLGSNICRTGITHAWLSASSILMAGMTAAGTLYVSACTVSGTTITIPGAPTSYSTVGYTSAAQITIAPVSATVGIVFYPAVTTANVIGMVCTVSGTTFTNTAPQTVDSTNTSVDLHNALVLSASQILLRGLGNLYLLGLSSGVLSEQNYLALPINSANSVNSSIIQTSVTSFKVFGTETGSGRPVMLQVNLVNGNTLVQAYSQYLNPTTTVQSTGGTAQPGVMAGSLGGTKIIWSYPSSASNFGTAGVGVFLS